MDVTIEPLDEFVVVQPIADEAETRAGSSSRLGDRGRAAARGS